MGVEGRKVRGVLSQLNVSLEQRKAFTLYKLDTVWKAEPLVLF